MIRPVSRRLTMLAVLAGFIAGLPALVHAQNARVSGVVRDGRGAPVEAAVVRVANEATGVIRSSSTTSSGAYAIGGLNAGTYTVSVSRIGFRRAARTGVRVDTEATVDFVLDPLPLEAVVVTATLREQELAQVPFSIAAPTAQTIRERGAENIEAIAVNVAGFSVQNLGPGQSQVAMRGASAGQIARDQPGVKEQVGVYLDDSPISMSLFTPDMDLFDVSRVEVLRGPQGTLFGSGSLAGTVRYISNQPELGVNSTFGEVGASLIEGGTPGGSVKLGTNLPVGDRAAARLAVYHNEIGGWMDAVRPDLTVRDNVNTGRRTGLRAALRYEPNERWSFTPRLVLQNVRMDGWNRIDDYNILANPFTTTRPAVTLGRRQLFLQIDEPFTDEYVLSDVNVGYDFGRTMLTSITSYAQRDILVVRDAGALTSSITGGSIGLPEEIYTLHAPLDDRTDVRVLTQELRLAGGTGTLRWLVGGFYSSNKRDYGQTLYVQGFEAGTGIPTQGLRAPRDVLFWSDLSYDLRQTALFGEATVSVTPQLDLTGGLRYYNFNEDRDQIFDAIFANDETGASLVSVPGSTSADGFAPRFIVSYRPTEMLTLNAQASKGFRLGGINDPLNEPLCSPQDLITFSGRSSWRDETAWNYEVGAKTRWAGGRMSLNVSAFHMDISDLQLVVTAGTCSSRLVFNVPSAISQGAEIELTARPSNFFDFAVSATFNNSELRSTLTSTDEEGTTVIAGIEEGNRLPSVPRIQASAAATLRQPLWTGADGYITGTLHHVGTRYTQISDFEPGFGTVDLLHPTVENTIGGPLTQTTFRFDPEMPAYNLINLRFGVNLASWDAALFINNLTDERALLALDRERGTFARVGYLTNQPRTVGVTVGFNY